MAGGGPGGGMGGHAGMGGFGGGFTDPEDLFAHIFGGGMGMGMNMGGGHIHRPRPGGPVAGDDVGATIGISFDESVNGTEREIVYSALDKCGSCDDTGSADKKADAVSTC